MKEKAPAFQFYPRDWLSEPNLRGAPLVVKGAYIELLAICWMEQDLPADSEELRRLAGATEQEWNICSTYVQRLFESVANDPERLFHKRLEDERDKHCARREQAAKAGRASGETRRKSSQGLVTSKTNNRSTGVEPNRTLLSSSSSSSSSSASPVRTRRPPVDLAPFERFWDAFDKKTEKPKAVKVWKKLDPLPSLALKIERRAKAYRDSTPDKSFRKAAFRWLRDEGWNDEIIERETGAHGNHLSKTIGKDFSGDPVSD